MQTHRCHGGRDTNQFKTLTGAHPGGQQRETHRHGGVSRRRGQKTGFHSRLRAENSQSEAGQMGKLRVRRGQQAGAAGLPGHGRAEDSDGVRERSWTAGARNLVHWQS